MKNVVLIDPMATNRTRMTRACFTSHPSGHQVDGLPLVAHIAREYYRRRAASAETGPVKIYDFPTFERHRLRAALMDRALALHRI